MVQVVLHMIQSDLRPPHRDLTRRCIHIVLVHCHNGLTSLCSPLHHRLAPRPHIPQALMLAITLYDAALHLIYLHRIPTIIATTVIVLCATLLPPPHTPNSDSSNSRGLGISKMNTISRPNRSRRP